MKVLALNGSPRMKASSTNHMLTPLLEGMEAAGAETELIHIRNLDLEACIGCYTCWVRTPGECIHKDKDGMAAALEQYNTADMVIFGTPVYHFTMTGIMKTFIDRTLPRLEPWLIPHPHLPGVTGHPERVHKPEKIFVVSACGFPEFDNFDPLLVTFKHMARMSRWEYLGEILRPGAEALSHHSLQGLFTDYYDLLRQAGEQIIRDGRISEGTQADLRVDLFPGGKQAFYDMSGAHWKQQIDRFKVPEEEWHTVGDQGSGNGKQSPSPDTENTQEDEPMNMNILNCHNTIAGMPTVFNPKAAVDLVADIQFDVTGNEPGSYYLQIENGVCSFQEGESSSPTMTIHTPSEVWLAISRGEMDGQSAFMQQKYTVEGNFSLLMKMNELFK